MAAADVAAALDALQPWLPRAVPLILAVLLVVHVVLMLAFVVLP